MKIGFTGTRRGMTVKQVEEVTSLIMKYKPDEVHHGVCIGADETFHAAVRTVAKTVSKPIRIEGHPSNLGNELRAKVQCDFMYPPEDPLVRNKAIVAAVDLMIATPKEAEERTGRGSGGTWATVREARRQGVKLLIIKPY